MELTTAGLAQPEEVKPAESEQPDGTKRGLMISGAFVVLVIAGYFLFTWKPETSTTVDSATMLKIQTMIGMGPKAGASRFIAPILGAVIIAAGALSLLSVGGRDLETAKEQSERSKKEKKPKAAVQTEAAAVPEPEEECNLASYKLFKSMDEAAEAAEKAAASQATPAAH